MNKIFAPLPFLLLLALVGCQSYETRQAVYVEKINGWVGKPEDALITTLGAPTNFYDSQGSRFLTYRRVRIESTRVPADCEMGLFGRFCYGGEVISRQYSCQETFAIRAGVVRRVNFDGDGCF